MIPFVKNFQVKNVSSSLCITSLVGNLPKFADISNVVSSDVRSTERWFVLFTSSAWIMI